MLLSCFSHGLTPCDSLDCRQHVFLSMGFSRQESWSGLPCSPPGDLPDPGIQPTSLMSPALADRFFTPSATWEVPELEGWRKGRVHRYDQNSPGILDTILWE